MSARLSLSISHFLAPFLDYPWPLHLLVAPFVPTQASTDESHCLNIMFSFFSDSHWGSQRGPRKVLPTKSNLKNLPPILLSLSDPHHKARRAHSTKESRLAVHQQPSERLVRTLEVQGTYFGRSKFWHRQPSWISYSATQQVFWNGEGNIWGLENGSHLVAPPVLENGRENLVWVKTLE